MTRDVEVEHNVDLLCRPSRACLAFDADGAVTTVPAALLFHEGRYWAGIPEAAEAPEADSEVVLLVDDGYWFFDLRAVFVRGRAVPGDAPPRGKPSGMTWCEVPPELVVAWDYGTLRAGPGEN